jgi:hypothetical protein
MTESRRLDSGFALGKEKGRLFRAGQLVHRNPREHPYVSGAARAFPSPLPGLLVSPCSPLGVLGVGRRIERCLIFAVNHSARIPDTCTCASAGARKQLRRGLGGSVLRLCEVFIQTAPPSAHYSRRTIEPCAGSAIGKARGMEYELSPRWPKVTNSLTQCPKPPHQPDSRVPLDVW